VVVVGGACRELPAEKLFALVGTMIRQNRNLQSALRQPER
jgi:hypothetical protein